MSSSALADATGLGSLEWATAEWPPAARRRLQWLLEPVGGVGLSPASRLAPGGCPVELSFSSTTPDTVRYATEASPLTLDPRRRLRWVVRRLQDAGLALPPAPLLRALDEVHAASKVVRFGVWVGGRHDGARERCKLYVDVPPGSAAVALRVLGASAPAPLPEGLGQLSFVGLQADGGVELYYEADGVSVADLVALARPLELADRVDELVGACGRILGRPLITDIPGRRIILSVARSPRGPELCVIPGVTTWFGTDRAARDRLLALAPELGWHLDGYARLTRDLDAEDGGPGCHTTLSVYLIRDGPVAVTVGLRPPRRSVRSCSAVRAGGS